MALIVPVSMPGAERLIAKQVSVSSKLISHIHRSLTASFT